jgi:hypothetical protein
LKGDKKVYSNSTVPRDWTKIGPMDSKVNTAILKVETHTNLRVTVNFNSLLLGIVLDSSTSNAFSFAANFPQLFVGDVHDISCEKTKKIKKSIN